MVKFCKVDRGVDRGFVLNGKDWINIISECFKTIAANLNYYLNKS